MQFVRLDEKHGSQRRTAADALEAIAQYRHLPEQASDPGEFHIGGMRLPSGEIAGLVNIYFESQALQTTFIVSLATSKSFRARLDGRPDFETLDIFKLDGATLSNGGSVATSEGIFLRSVEVLPSYLPLELSELELRILRRTISLLGIEDQCYVHPSRRNDPELLAAARESGSIDFSTFHKFCAFQGSGKLMLKQIQGSPSDWPNGKAPSPQKIADTLTKVGMRQPGRRRRTHEAREQ